MFAPQKVKQGVRIPVEQSGNEQGQPNTVRRVAKMEMLGIEFFDKSGQKHETVVVVMGGRVFVPTNAEQWLFECKAAAPWLERAALERLNQLDKPVSVPSEDAVDVLTGG